MQNDNNDYEVFYDNLLFDGNYTPICYNGYPSTYMYGAAKYAKNCAFSLLILFVLLILLIFL